MPVQLTYDIETPIGVDGQRIEAYGLGFAITGIAETVAIRAGKLCVFDTAAGRAQKAVKLPTATGEVTTVLTVAGLSLWDPTYPEPPYPIGQALPIMRKGRIAIAAETALAVHTNPFVRFAVGPGGTVLGALRNDADTASAVAAPYLHVVRASTAAGDIAIVEIDL